MSRIKIDPFRKDAILEEAHHYETLEITETNDDHFHLVVESKHVPFDRPHMWQLHHN